VQRLQQEEGRSMRARWLKPEFFTDKKIAALGPVAALVYQALWCMADDGGTAPCDADTIKAQMFYRWSAVGVPEISEALRHLSDSARIVRYSVGDDEYARIAAWEAHQQVHKPSKFRHPPMPQAVARKSAGKPGTGATPLPASPPPRHLDSQTPRHPSEPPAAVGSRRAAEDAFDALWPKYPGRSGGNSRKSAKKAYLARVASGVTTGDLAAGAERYAAYILATGKVRTEFVLQGATFFGPDDHWREPWDIPAPSLVRSTGGTRIDTPAQAHAAMLWARYREHNLLTRWEKPEYERIGAVLVAAGHYPSVAAFLDELRVTKPWTLADARTDGYAIGELAIRLQAGPTRAAS
jgi:hypothetical protein